MKTTIFLLAVLGIGCGAGGPEPLAKSVAGVWTFSLAASAQRAACTGQTTLTERAWNDMSIQGGIEGVSYVDGLWSCADGSASGIFGGERTGNAMEFAVDCFCAPPESTSNDAVILRTVLDVSDDAMTGDGFSAIRVK